MNKYRWIFLFLLSSFQLYAADSTIVSFSIGNSYSFGGTEHWHGSPNYTPITYSENIIADTIIDGHRYSIFLRSQTLQWSYSPIDTGIIFYRRSDSTSIYQYIISSATEDTIVNFKDTIGTVYNSGYSIAVKYSYPVFGKYYPSIIMSSGHGYSVKLFLISYFAGGLPEIEIYLKGAKIEGIYYGDSTLVSVKSNSNMNFICSDYVLYQNIPVKH